METYSSAPNIEIKIGDEMNAVLQYKAQLASGVLDLSDRRIEEQELEYVNELVHLCQCHHLVLTQNMLERTREPFPSFITVLDLSLNRLTALSLEGLSCLVELNVSRNNLESLEGVDCCPALQTLNASHNEISFVCGYAANAQLTELDLSSNKIATVEDLRGVSVWGSVRTFDVTGNPLMDVPHVRLTIKHLLSNLVWLNSKKQPSSPKVGNNREKGFGAFTATPKGERAAQGTPKMLGYASIHKRGEPVEFDRSPIQVSKHDLELSKMGFANSRRKNVSRNENANGQGGEKKRNASKHSRSVPRSEGWGKRMPRERKIDRSRGPARRKGAERGKKHARSAISARGKATTGITRKQTQSLRPSSPGSDIDMEKMLAKMIKHKRSLLSKLQATMADNA